MCAGKQRKLTAWLGAVSAKPSSKPTACAQPDFDSQPAPAFSPQAGLSHAGTVFQSPSRADSPTTAACTDSAAASGRHLLSSFTRKSSGVRAGSGKLGGKTGQTSLRAFMQRPAADAAAKANAASASNAVEQSINSVPMANHSNSTAACVTLLGIAPTGSSDSQDHKTAIKQSDAGAIPGSSGAQHSAQLPKQDYPQLSSPSTLSELHSLDAISGTSEQLAPDRGQKRSFAPAHDLDIEKQRPDSASTFPESQPDVSTALDTEKAAVTAAWSKIQSKMKAPKCRGHNEDCVIREVKKNGPNKGETAHGKHSHQCWCHFLVLTLMCC